MRVIGDVHGKINTYWKLIQNQNSSIQLGDFGFKKQHDWHLENIDSNKHKVLFGNHDYYPYLQKQHSLGDFNYSDGIFCVRGAYSIDKHHRVEGRDWFVNEELSYMEFQTIIDEYEKVKPDVVISHDCPISIYVGVLGIHDSKSITPKALDMMFETHKPKMWIFGHHHRDLKVNIKGTDFICLDELSYIDI